MIKQYKAVALCRVSSLEQLQNNSLSSQKDNVLKAAEFLNVIIPHDGVWAGHQSAKKGMNYNRKDLLEIYEFCRRHKDVKYLIVQEVDRFMRSPEEQTYWYVRFWYELGVQVWFADKPELNENSHNASLFRFLEGWRAGGSNEERITKSINGGTKGLEQGRYPFAPKPGYMKGRVSGVPDVHPVRGPALKRVLVSMADHGVDPTQALKDLNSSEFMQGGRAHYKMDKFRLYATSPFYAGIVEVNKQIRVRNEFGLHEPLITIEQHKKLLEVFNNKPKYQKGPSRDGNKSYPLASLVTCLPCESNGVKNCRFSGVSLKNGKPYSKVYEKYRCNSCNRYISKDELHTQVGNALKPFTFKDSSRRSLMLSLLNIWKTEEKTISQDISRLSANITNLTKMIRLKVAAAVEDSNITIKEDLLNQIEEHKCDIKKIERKISDLETLTSANKEHFLDFAFDFLGNINDTFIKTDMSKTQRTLCKDLLIPGGFYVDADNRVYTKEISPIYTLKINKKDTEVSDLARMVRVRRL